MKIIIAAILASTLLIENVYASALYQDPYHYIYYKKYDNKKNISIQAKSQIPREIVESKDCKAFFQWQSNHNPAIIPIQRCPFIEYGEVRNLKIDDLSFKIPRSFLVSYSDITLDEEAESISWQFTYTPTIGDTPKNTHITDVVEVWTESVKHYMQVSNIDKLEYLEIKYWDSLNLPFHTKKSEFELVDKGFDRKLGRNHYIFQKRFKPGYIDPIILSNYTNHAYVIGDPLKPKDFVVCREDNNIYNPYNMPLCYCGFFYKNLYTSISFPKKDLEKYQDFKKVALALLKKWEQ